jgi:hypothetical protein
MNKMRQQIERKWTVRHGDGMPLSFEIEWPFHKSTSGADFGCCMATSGWKGRMDLHAP